MADQEPLSELVLGSGFYAEDLSFHGLIDVSGIIAEKKIHDARVIGGHMVTFHVLRWGLGQDLYRTTLDADLGVPPFVIRSEGIVAALQELGYERSSGNRFRREIPELRGLVQENFAVVDVLVPSYISRPRQNVRVSEELTTIEVPGLATAFLSEPVTVAVDLSTVGGQHHQIEVRLPDERCALVLKGLAWRQRRAAKDIVDVWRLLEVAVAAGLSLEHELGEDGDAAASAIRKAFSSPASEGAVALAKELKLNDEAASERFARVQALMDRVLRSQGDSAS